MRIVKLDYTVTESIESRRVVVVRSQLESFSPLKLACCARTKGNNKRRRNDFDGKQEENGVTKKASFDSLDTTKLSCRGHLLQDAFGCSINRTELNHAQKRLVNCSTAKTIQCRPAANISFFWVKFYVEQLKKIVCL